MYCHTMFSDFRVQFDIPASPCAAENGLAASTEIRRRPPLARGSAKPLERDRGAAAIDVTLASCVVWHLCKSTIAHLPLLASFFSPSSIHRSRQSFICDRSRIESVDIAGAISVTYSEPCSPILTSQVLQQ